MLVGDIGDNTASRDLVRVFWFDEPALGTTTGSWASWELVYPDGPHDAEALAADPATGRVVVVTKGATGGIYALPDAPTRQGVNRLEKVGTVDARVTDATYLPDGSALVVRTYTSLLVLDPVTWAVQATARLPLQPQGETVTVLGDAVLVGSEGRGSRLVPVTVPAEVDHPTGPDAVDRGRDRRAPGHRTGSAAATGRPRRGAGGRRRRRLVARRAARRVAVGRRRRGSGQPRPRRAAAGPRRSPAVRDTGALKSPTSSRCHQSPVARRSRGW